MEYEQMLDSVLKSHRSSWEQTDDDCYVHKTEAMLCIKNEGIINNEYKEKWAINHPDPNAYTESYKIYYSNIPIKEVTLVTVNNDAKVPLPESGTRDIKDSLAYRVATIVSDKCDEYIQKCGLKNSTGLYKAKVS